jgi:hypothetical protein
MFISSAIGLLRNVALAPIIGAHQLGYYGLMLLVVQFSVYATTWGVLDSFNVELPVAYGASDPEIPQLEAKTFSSVLVPTALATLTFLVAVAVVNPNDPSVRDALLLAAPVAVLGAIFEYYLLVLRARQRLMPLSSLFLLRAVLAIGLGVLGGALAGFHGVAVADIVASLAVVLACIRLMPDIRPARPDLQNLVRHVRAGIPLAASLAAVTLTYTVDRLFVAANLKNDFGQYTFAAMVVPTAIVVKGIFRQMIYPQILYDFGAGIPIAELRGRVWKLTLGTIALGMLAVGVLVVFANTIGDGVFPGYGPGLHTMPVLLFGSILSVAAVSEVVIMAGRRFHLLTIATLAALVTTVAGCAVVTMTGKSIMRYAWVFVISQIVLAVITTVMAARLAEAPAATSEAETESAAAG